MPRLGSPLGRRFDLPSLDGKRDGHPVIVRRKKVIRHTHAVGAWKVAFADFVTALMALFIVLWIVGQSKQVRKYVSEYFRDPGAFSAKTQASIFTDAVQLWPEETTGQGSAKPKEEDAEESQESQRRMLTAAGEKLREMLKSTPEFVKLRRQVEIELTSEGMRIQLIDEEGFSFFDVGSARLKQESIHLLQRIAEELTRLPNPVVVEGHTDSRAYASASSYGNWELSTDRANAARRILEDAGMRRFQVREVRGHADRILRNAADPFDVRNRRISIIVLLDTSSPYDHPALPEASRYIPLH